MNASKILVFALAAVVGLLVITGILRLAGRVFRSIIEVNYRESPAYTAWLLSTIAMLGAAFIPVMNMVVETTALTYGTAVGNSPAGIKSSFMTASKTTGILILLAAAWFWIWQLVSEYLIVSIWGKTKAVTEMELGNTGYFVVRYGLALLCMLVMYPFYLSLLHYFIPDISIPFYR